MTGTPPSDLLSPIGVEDELAGGFGRIDVHPYRARLGAVVGALLRAASSDP